MRAWTTWPKTSCNCGRIKADSLVRSAHNPRYLRFAWPTDTRRICWRQVGKALLDKTLLVSSGLCVVYSVVMDYLEVLKSERAIHQRHVDALDSAIKLLEKVEDPLPTKPASTRQKVACPDCGKKISRGPGMAAHRKVHGWQVGMPLDQPVVIVSN